MNERELSIGKAGDIYIGDLQWSVAERILCKICAGKSYGVNRAKPWALKNAAGFTTLPRAMPRLRRIRLTKTDLNRIPDDERFFYFMAGHLANDTNILSKLLITAFNSAFARPRQIPRDEVHNNAGLAQLFLVLKLLSGRLHEANSLISSHYFGKGLHKKYESEMSERAQDGRRRLSAYFGGEDNILTKIRNKFAFHLSRPEIEFVYQDLPEDFEFIQFLGEYTGHTLFVGSTILSINAMTILVEGSTPLDAIDKIYKDAAEVSQWLTLFLNGYMQVTINRYLTPIKREQVTYLTMPDEPSISLTTIPFFSDPPSTQNRG